MFYATGDDLFAQGRPYKPAHGAVQGAGAEARAAALEGYAPDDGLGEDRACVLSVDGLTQAVEVEKSYLGKFVVAYGVEDDDLANPVQKLEPKADPELLQEPLPHLLDMLTQPYRSRDEVSKGGVRGHYGDGVVKGNRAALAVRQTAVVEK